MTREIERKWLCNGFPADMEFEHDWDVEQAYIFTSPEVEIRLHKKIDRQGQTNTYYCLTTKIGNGLERIELSVPLDAVTYELFMKEVKGTPIHKRFRIYRLGEHRLDIGFVDDKFYYAEIEFKSQEEALAFAMPFNWQEVTGESYHQMKNYWERKNNLV